MLSPEQIAAMMAAGIPAAQIAAMMNPGAPAAAGDPLLNSLKNAPDPRNSLQSLSHPEDTGLEFGRGRFDGEYAITIETLGFEPTKKGQILKNVFVVDESTCLAVPVGSKREHPLFQWVDAAVSETKGFLQILFEAKGGQGSWEDEPGCAFYYAATGEPNSCKGLRFHLSVFTEPQRRNANKFFTKHRYTPIAVGQVLGLSAKGTVAAPVIPPSVPGGAAYAYQAPAATTVATVAPTAGPKLASEPPAGWPPNVPWPGAAK